MHTISNKQIAIVGGGPGGLTLARLLQQEGASVRVYERDLHKDVRVQGATLDLHEESGLKALEHAGLMDAFKANYRPGADKMRIVDQHAHILMDEQGSEATGAFRPEIDRGPLRKILLESLQPGTVVWDSQLSSLEKADGRWLLQFRNGSTATADLVVAADGANSRIRPLITEAKPFYSGITVVEGAVYHVATALPYIDQLLNGGKVFALDGVRSLIVSTKGDGSLAFYTGCRTDADWVKDSGIDFADKDQVLAWFRDEFKDWDPLWQELIVNAETPLMPRPQYCMPPDQTWTAQADLTMLGDAAHVMPPYAGEGVNMAMLDALELSECLCDERYTDTGAAISAYENSMRQRIAETATLTLEQTEALHSAGAAQHMLNLFNDLPGQA
ncbi:FAD-dependent oxidoreductase [Taibaiella chishuiensis]|uniref:Flavin-dependent monooxygenase n=1 Tax=Taibaiella chishuiensis TaxID=1434707 RepID=A0A2P8CX70_9BACT|nr:NAD(P)/FAD-dependent oxidoreductase [Taibaiella chishuiensis]PSK89581.1 2-polyprenyl-6-methoxyphenol hydroxylase-like FAD-dependent oxidoreductase [Taibaiella chishuiensis]